MSGGAGLGQYGGSFIIGAGQPVFDQMVLPRVTRGVSVGALDFAFRYCYMMGGITGVVVLRVIFAAW